MQGRQRNACLETRHRKLLKRLKKPTKNYLMLMNELADPSTIQLVFLFPFLPVISVFIVSILMLGELPFKDDDDDDDDRGTLVPAYYPT